MTKRCSLRKTIKGVDIYAKPINLTYKGKEKFSSTLGGTLSLIVLFALISLFFYKLNDMIDRKQTQIRKNSLVSISNSYTAPEVISSKNITFAFMLSNFYGEGSYDNPHYGKLILLQEKVVIKNIIDGVTYRDYYQTEIPYSKCELGKNFFYDNAEEVKMYGIDQYYCPDWQNLTIQGNWYSPEYMVITLQFQRCFDATCANDTEFEEWFKQLTMQEIFISSYFDIEDYNNPIHYFLDDNYVSLQYGRSIIYSTFIQRNLLYLNDKFFNLFMSHEEDYFYTRAHTDYFTSDDTSGPGKGVYFHQNLKLAKEYDRYERSVYTITGVLQDVGGFYNSLFFIGLVLSVKFQRTIFFSTLFSLLYQVELQDDEVNSEIQNQRRTLNSHDQESFRHERSHIKTNALKDKLQNFITSNQTQSKDFTKLMKEYILRRVRIKFTSGNIIGYTMASLLCPCVRRGHQKESKIQLDRKQLFQYGHNRILKDLDCINLLNQVRQFDQISNILFKNYQQFLMKFSSRSLINSNVNDSQDHEMIPQYTENLKYELQRIRQEQSVKMKLQNLQQETFSEIDKKLLLQIISGDPSRILDSNGNLKKGSLQTERPKVYQVNRNFNVNEILVEPMSKQVTEAKLEQNDQAKQKPSKRQKKSQRDAYSENRRIKSKKTEETNNPPFIKKDSSALTLRNPLQDSQRIELLETPDDLIVRRLQGKSSQRKKGKSKRIRGQQDEYI